MIQRRQFLQGCGGLVVAFSLAAVSGCSPRATREQRKSPIPLNAWVQITRDGRITIFSPADELGQGSSTALPLILAEELDANWDEVDVLMSPADDDLYGNPEFGGLIYTAASTAVLGYFDRLRMVGAETRQLLLWNAAKHWNVPIIELSTAPSRVRHVATGRSLSYGEIAAFAETPTEPLPQLSAADLKPRQSFRLIGHDVMRRDVPAKIAGTAQYSIDVSRPGMLIAAVERAPALGAKVDSIDDTEARKVDGVLQVLRRDESVIVIADNFTAALAGRRALRVVWSNVGDIAHFDSEEAMAAHRRLAADFEIAGNVWDQSGDIRAEPSEEMRRVHAEYQTDYVYHAQMEPLNAVAQYDAKSGHLQVWAGTQAPTQTSRTVARVTGIATTKVLVHRCVLGGAFGRRSLESMDYVVDAAWAAYKLKKCVKVIWSREDDIAQGWFKPMTAHRLDAGVSLPGDVLSWRHRVAVQEPLATAETRLFEMLDRRPIVAMRGAEHTVYRLPNRLIEHLPTAPGVRTYPLLGVGVTPNNFAIESFVDELAHSVNADPLEFRLKLVGGSSRAAAVLNAVAKSSGWREGRVDGVRALGLAFVNYHGSMLAGVAQVSVAVATGLINVHEFWVAIDPGYCVQPRNVVSQVEGAIIFGLGNALRERVTFVDGKVQQSNFHNYQVLRINDIPAIHVEVLQSGEQPSAVGQTGAVIVAPAVANAVAALTGKRLRHMPFLPERVRQTLA